MRRISLAASGLIIILLAFAARPAGAHANLVRSEPGAGAVLDVAPDTLKLWFSEVPEPTFSAVQLFDRAGNTIPGVGALRVDATDSTLVTAQLPQLKPGIYTVAWRTASAVDGHVTNGGFAFVIGRDQVLPDGLIPQSTGNAAASDVTAMAIVVRWVSYLSLALLVGGFAFVPLAFRPASMTASSLNRPSPPLQQFDLHRLLAVGWLLLLVASVYAAFLEAASTGTDLFSLLIATRYGELFGFRVVLLAGVGGILALHRSSQRSVRWWYAGLILGGILLLIISLSSHAAAIPGPLFPVIADLLHVAAMSIWLGGLIVLLLMLRHIRRTNDWADFSLVLVSRFSDVATICVAILGFTGVVQMFFQVSDLYNLLITSYGLALLAKLLLLVPLLSLGALNLYVTRRKIAQAIKHANTGGTFPSSIRLIMRSVTAEIALLFIILAVTGVLTSLPPAREALGSGAVAHGQADDLNIVVAVNPGLPGLNTFDIYVKDSLFRPVKNIQKVALIFGMLEHDMGQEEATAVQVGDGHFVVQGSYLSMIGTWQVEAVVRRTGMYDTRTSLTFPVLALKQPPTSPVLLAPSRAIAGLAILSVGALFFGATWYLRRTGPRFRRVLVAAGVIALILSLAVGSTGFGSGMGSILIVENPVAPNAASLQRGAKLYINNCLACHGETGAGDGPVGVSLKPHPSNLQMQLRAKYTDGQLFDLLTRGIPSSTMPGFGMTLTDQDRWDIINYIETFPRGR